MQPLTAWVMASLLIQAGAVHAAPKPVPFIVECPATLPAGAVPMQTVLSRWTVAAVRPWAFDGSGMLHGAPDEEAYLVPDATGSAKRVAGSPAVRRWTFELPHGYEKWVYCAYGPVQLAQRTPVDATECTATEKTDGGKFKPTVFVCR